jgi:hypothetical protein
VARRPLDAIALVYGGIRRLLREASFSVSFWLTASGGGMIGVEWRREWRLPFTARRVPKHAVDRTKSRQPFFPGVTAADRKPVAIRSYAARDVATVWDGPRRCHVRAFTRFRSTGPHVLPFFVTNWGERGARRTRHVWRRALTGMLVELGGVQRRARLAVCKTRRCPRHGNWLSGEAIPADMSGLAAIWCMQRIHSPGKDYRRTSCVGGV